MTRHTAILACLIFILALLPTTAYAEHKKPNILIIWGDDVGMYNISAYHRGLMGGRTPSIDRIAKEGMLFIDHYRRTPNTWHLESASRCSIQKTRMKSS